MDRQGPPNRPRYQLTRGLTRIRHEKDAMTLIGKHGFHPWCPDGRAGGRREIVCPGCISETVRCRKLILGRDIG